MGTLVKIKLLVEPTAPELENVMKFFEDIVGHSRDLNFFLRKF